MTEVGVAYVNIVPKTDGFSSSVADASREAGSEGGKSISSGLMDTLQSTTGDLFGTGGEMGSSLSGGMESFLGGAGKLAIGAAVAAIGVEALAQLEQIGEEIDAMTDTIIVGTGASGESLEEMKQIAMGMSQDVAVSFAESGDIVQDFNTRLGLQGDELQTVATQVAKLNHITGGINYDKMATMFNVWGVGADEMTAKMDYLWGVSQNTGIGFDSLTSIMQSSAPALQGLGFTFEESANMAGLLDKAGIDASSTMSKMSKALVELAEPGESAQEAFARTIDEMQSYIDTGDKAAALDIASEVFGTKGAAQFISALESGALSMDALSDAALGASGSIDETYEATASWPEQWATIQSSIAAALEPIATGVFSTIGAILTGFGDAMNFLWEKTEPVREVIGEVAAGIGERLQPVIDAISPFLQGLGDVLGNVIAVAFDAIAGAIDTVAGAISWLWDNILAPFGQWLEETLGPIIDTIAGLLSGIAEAVGGAVDAAGKALSDYGNAVVTTMGGDWQAAAIAAEQGYYNVQTTAETSMDAASTAVEDAGERVEEAMDMEEVPEEVGQTFDEAGTAMEDPIDEAVDDINSQPQAIVNAYTGIGARLSNAFGSVHFPTAHISYDEVQVGDTTTTVPNITWYARGGFVDGATLIGAGEAGPEMILPQQGELMDEFAAAITEKMGGGNTVNVYLQYDAGEDASQLATDIARILDRKLALEGAA